MRVAQRVRAWSGMVVIALLMVLLAACGGGDDDSPTESQPAPAATVSAPTAAATTPPGPAPASPLASPVTVPPLASPVGSPAAAAAYGASSLTREQFQQQLLQAYPMEPAANRGGTVILGEPADISTVNALLANDSLTLNVVGTMFEPLLGLSPIDGRPVPALADSWDVSPDGLTYTFHINERATWHDGVDVTAEDVKFSFDAVLDPNTGSSYTTVVNEAVASYRVVDADTFEMTARDRFVSFLYNGPGSVFIMPKHVWASVDLSSWSFDGGSTGQDPARIVGSGPFKFKEWQQGVSVSVVRNDAYYDVVPTIDEFTVAVQPDAEAAVLALQGGETDIMEIIPPAQTQSVIDTEGRTVDVYNFFQMTYYAFNLDPERSQRFVDKGVRQALFYALDRDSITRDIFFGYGEAAVGTQPKLSPAYAPDRMSPEYAYDPARAKELLAQAGWTDADGNGTLEKDGEEFSFALLYNGGDATVDQLVAYLQEAWAAVGVKMQPESIEGGILLDRWNDHDFDMTLLAIGLTPDGDQGQLFSCDAYRNGFNFMRYCNEQWDQLQERQRREFDAAARTELLVQQSQIVWDEQPIGPIRFGIARTGSNVRIHNFHPNGFGFLWSLPYLWVDP